MNIYSIYKATNKINGKVYIGFDSNWPNRKKTHKSKYKQINLKFYDAIKKYGWDKFDWELIYQSKDGQHCLNIMEPHFIEDYDSFNNGYNMTLGGEGVLGLKGEKSPWYGRKHTPESKEKISKNNKGKQIGKKLSKNTKSKISNSTKGKIFSVETKTKISISKNKIYYFINPQNEKIEIKGLKSFCNDNNLSYSCMRQLLYGKSKQHKGWKCC